MAKEKDYETIEGGDDSSDAFDFESTLVKPATKDEKEEGTSEDEEEVEFRDREPVEERIEGGDTQWDEEQGDKEEIEEVEIEEKPTGEKEALSEEEKQDKKDMEDAIVHLEGIPESEGGGTKYRIKGRDHDLKDLSPQEFKNRFSLAGRAHERMQESADKERVVNEKERRVQEVATQVQERMNRLGGGESKRSERQIPEALKPHEDDTELERSLKQINVHLHDKVNNLERGFVEQQDTAVGDKLCNDLEELHDEFPVGSREEALAIKAMRPDLSTRDIMEASHRHYSGKEYIDSALKANPEYHRELREQAIEEHLTKKPNVSKVSRKSSSTVASGKVSSGKKKTPRTLDQIEAHVDSRGGWDNVVPDSDED